MQPLSWWFLPTLGMVEGLALLCLPGGATQQEWGRVASAVGPSGGEPSIVMVSPAWAEPLARAHLDSSWWSVADVARPDDLAYGHALQIVGPWGGAEAPVGWTVVGEERHGRLRVRRLLADRWRAPMWRLVDGIANGTTKARYGASVEGPAECTWRADAPVVTGGLGGVPTIPATRFQCGDVSVGVTVIDDEHFSPRRCAWVGVSPTQWTLLQFEVPPGATRISGHVGSPWLLDRDDHGPPLVVEILRGERPIADITHRGDEGWKPFELTLGESPSAPVLTMRVRPAVTARRGLCIQADAG